MLSNRNFKRKVYNLRTFFSVTLIWADCFHVANRCLRCRRSRGRGNTDIFRGFCGFGRWHDARSVWCAFAIPAAAGDHNRWTMIDQSGRIFKKYRTKSTHFFHSFQKSWTKKRRSRTDKRQTNPAARHRFRNPANGIQHDNIAWHAANGFFPYFSL